MYTYKYISIPHSIWTRKPEEKIENVIDDYAAHGWRLVQVLRETNSSGKIFSKIIFEREVPEDYYNNPAPPSQLDANPNPNPKNYNSDLDEFV